MMKSIMVSTYMLFCVCIATRPCKFFQLNARHFDDDAGIFSKQKMDALIPSEWRLKQEYDDGATMPDSYPVFVKPEWSQNARGVMRADDAAALQNIRASIAAAAGAKTRHLLQQCAHEKNEYEIFAIAKAGDASDWATLSVTHARNESEANPINGIYNPNTKYDDITDAFGAAQLATIWTHLQRIGNFPIARLSVRADSVEALLQGAFHVIELNLFLPMPIHMLDKKYSRMAIWRFIRVYMMQLALATKHRARGGVDKPVFWKSMLYNRRGRVANFIRERL